jgi:succinate-semialdehyde dehydrogenase/glutarate-semialdehyde dehydrogenase
MTATAAAASVTGVLVSYDPATGDEVGRVRITAPEDVSGVAAQARRAQAGWAAQPTAARAQVMRRAARILHRDMQAISREISREQGKPLLESLLHDVFTGIETCLWCASDVPRLLKPERVRSPQLHYRHKRHELHYEPLGVVGIISPWNFPFSIPFTEAVIALSCGNAVVLKPSELTPLIADRIGAVLAEAGVPPDVFNVVHGYGATGGALVSSGVEKIFFTGSVSTGKAVMRQAADTLTPVVLELGGKDPMLVLDDANLDLAARGATWGAFANAGQICASVERVYVDQRIAPAFVERVVDQARKLRVGRFDEDGVDVGPMISDRQRDVVGELVDDAVANGASLLVGGPDPRGGRFYQPTVLTGVKAEMRIMHEEIFGPVMPIVAVASDDEAVALANDSEFGLSASVWSRSPARAARVADRIQAGSVWINDHAYSHNAPQLPWGGVKHSGFGRSHSKHGVYECCQVKMVGLDRGRLPRPWYYPYGSREAAMVPRLLGSVYGRGLVGRIAAALRKIPT